MTFPDVITLAFWNGLVSNHFTQIVMVLTAALVTLSDRYVRRLVNKLIGKKGRLIRFAAFMVVVSFGYTGMTFGFAYLVKRGIFFQGGAYMALVVLVFLTVIAWEASRQRHV